LVAESLTYSSILLVSDMTTLPSNFYHNNKI
jgi:hypothetical protein